MASVETYEIITIDALTEKSVSILVCTMADINGKSVQVGENWRCAYENTKQGRIDLEERLGKHSGDLAAVLAKWGDRLVNESPLDENF